MLEALILPQQEDHAHALSEYDLVRFKHYLKLLISVVQCKLKKYKSLTAHLPFEIQHPEFCKPFKKGLNFVSFGEILKEIFKVNLYWENAPWLNRETWDLKYTNTVWDNIPKNIDLCLDTGHLMLGCKNKSEFLIILEKILLSRKKQIKHFHLHENEFIYDSHNIKTRKILDKELVKRIIQGKTYIWEKSI